ncbi:mercury transporter [Pedobacter sp. KBW01]|uniref:DUF3347 domain-containing protein n=1 Tax=Pedobacter sp. KBW01 TaxID=2153364 RepID=UPI000F59A6FA|nr:DUF3347 domain-containing protein [Pedobacter sp. KBW01]RQO73391.1 mercury transporter [Pedobacter sp. KBW01]
MKLTSKIWMVITLLLSATNAFAQIKNAQTVSIQVSGNCEMCKKTIESAANIKSIAAVNWNETSKMASITYNNQKTNTDEILKRIALAGYDNTAYLAPDEVYAKLPECCRYNRTLKPVSKMKEAATVKADHNHQGVSAAANTAQLKTVFEQYFALKDALVKSDANAAGLKATALLNAIKAVEMEKLNSAEHSAWMAAVKTLTTDVTNLSKSKDITDQRQTFSSLSVTMYPLAKVAKQDMPVYYQHCPMYNNGRGANWLSKESTVKNPFYGSKMLTCGSTVEILK